MRSQWFALVLSKDYDQVDCTPTPWQMLTQLQQWAWEEVYVCFTRHSAARDVSYEQVYAAVGTHIARVCHWAGYDVETTLRFVCWLVRSHSARAYRVVSNGLFANQGPSSAAPQPSAFTFLVP